jgi:hypothetical protein
MPEEVSVQADPTPEPTPEEAARLRLQLERNRAMYEGAGMGDETKATETRLSELGEEPTEETPEPEPAPEPKLDDLKKDELRALADERGLEVPESATKAELVEALEGPMLSPEEG